MKTLTYLFLCSTLSFCLQLSGQNFPRPVQSSLNFGAGWQAYEVANTSFNSTIRQGNITSTGRGTVLRPVTGVNVWAAFQHLISDRISLLAKVDIGGGFRRPFGINSVVYDVTNAPGDMATPNRLFTANAGLLVLYELRPWRQLSWTIGGGFGANYRHYRYLENFELSLTPHPNNILLGLSERYRKTGQYSLVMLLQSQVTYPINNQVALTGQAHVNVMENEDISYGIGAGVKLRLR